MPNSENSPETNNIRKYGSPWSQLQAITRRNFIIKKRNLTKSLGEVVSTYYYVALLVFVSFFVRDQNYEPVSDLHDGSGMFMASNRTLLDKIHVSPNSSQVKRIMDEVVTQNEAYSISFQMYPTENDIISRHLASKDVTVAVIFTDDPLSNSTYKIRLKKTKFLLPMTTALMTPNSNCRKTEINKLESGLTCLPNRYFHSGFLSLQAAIDAAIVKLRTGFHLTTNGLFLRSLPRYSSSDSRTLFLRYFVPLNLVAAWMQFFLYVLILIVDEKEKKTKEAMKIMGLNSLVYWLSWMSYYAIVMCVLSITCPLILQAVGIYKMSSVLLLFILFFLSGISMIGLGLSLTPLFSSAKTAGSVGNIFFFGCYLLTFAQKSVTNSHVSGISWIMSLLSPYAFTVGLDKALILEDSYGGISWQNIWMGPGLSFGEVLIMLCLDIVLYLLIGFYLDSVISNGDGTKQRFYFPCQPSYWFSKRQNSGEEELLIEDLPENEDMEPVDEEVHSSIAIQFRHLSKVFKTGKEETYAVKDFCLNIYENEITAILGHNGAGKTTLFNIITGITTPSFGTVSVFGHDIRNPNSLDKIRRMTGFCPQHNINFSLLTTEEHLYFYARLRGVSEDKLSQTVKKTIEEVGLVSQTCSRSSKLSGGQLRKLSIAIALIGEPKVIFLDEPTAGVSLESRGELWTLLKNKKHGKVIVMTTHFMDEADVLSDRKIIMSKGSIRCGGSSLFLKNRFGLGYNLTLTLNGESSEETVTAKIKKEITSITAEKKHGRELIYLVPSHATSELSKLCQFLEESISSGTSFGVDCYSVGITTLEQVFLRLNEDLTEDSMNMQNFRQKVSMECSVNREQDSSPSRTILDAIEIEKSFWRTCWALFKIRFLIIIREPMAIIFTIFVPILILILSMQYSIRNTGTDGHFDSLLLSPGLYNSQTDNVAVYNGTGVSLEFLTTVCEAMGLITTEYNNQYNYLNENPPHFSAFSLKEFSTDKISVGTIFFNASFAHILPVVVNLWSNMFIGASMPNVTDGHLIHVLTENLPLSEHSGEGFDANSMAGPTFLGIVFVMVPSVLVLSIVYDREIGIRNLLRLNGVHFTAYFLSFFSSMFVYYFISYISLLIIIAVYQVPSLVIPAAFVTVCISYFLYIPYALISNAYFTYFFDKGATARSFYPSLSITIGTICYFIVMITDLLLYRTSSKFLHYFFVMFVPYYIPYGVLYKINTIYVVCTLNHSCLQLTMSDYAEPEILVIYLSCIFGAFFWGYLLRCADMTGNIIFCKSVRKPTKISPPSENTNNLSKDASDEKTKAYHCLLDSVSFPTLVTYDIEQTYEKSRMLSCFDNETRKNIPKTLEGVSLVVEEGNLFGLLGPNGAGKTTMMRVLTAEVVPSKGLVKICGESVTSTLSPALENLGYCPQQDCLWKNISVREHIECYAQIGGLKTERLIDLYVDCLQIGEHMSKKSQEISGGTKRKLCYIISMMGVPKMLLLDEPSTGLDPLSKKHLWDVIRMSFSGNRSAILTTHSMDEAEALCSRIGIMVGGSFRVMGSPQKLKDRFGFGYIVELKLSRQENVNLCDAQARLEDAVKAKFEQSSIRESFGELVKISVPSQRISEVFLFFEKLKADVVIEDYTVAQRSLEEMFIYITMSQEQIDADKRARENEQSIV